MPELLPPFALALARLRAAAGLSQAQLALAVGVAQPRIAEYERGHKAPSLGAAGKLADALGCSLDQLAGRVEKE